jgi:cytosine deaminase
MTALPDVPDGDALLRNATVPACAVDVLPEAAAVDADGLTRLDIALRDGRIEAMGAQGNLTVEGLTEVDLDDGMVLPCFADVHTHLDKGHIWPRTPNPDGTRPGAISAVAADRAQSWSAGDVRARMDFALRCAYAHGTAAIRTHLDSTPPQDAISWPVFEELRAEWKGRIALQASALDILPAYEDDGFAVSIADRVKAAGGILGAVLNIQKNTDALLDKVIRLAIERDLELDFHVDEMTDPEAKSFDAIAEALIRNRYGRPVNVGHCCALALRSDDEIDRALDLAAEAQMRVAALPMCNMYLQDRSRTPPDANAPRNSQRRTPRWRGVTILHEMKARGIPVAVSSDNTRDPFYAWGDLDMTEVFTQAVRIAQLDHPVGDWPAAVARTPADTMGAGDVGRLAAGGPADMILFRARDWSEFLARPQRDRTVIRSGKAIDAVVPDYRELDAAIGR